MEENAKLNQAVVDQIEALGFSRASITTDIEGFAKLSACRPDILGVCLPIDTHTQFLAACEWQEGTLLLAKETSPRFVLWEQFFCLETLDFPKNLMALRDYFDYGLEAKIRDLRPDVQPIFGPAWRYLFPCVDFEKNLKLSTLSFSAPMIGNALNIRADSLSDLLSAHSEIKRCMGSQLPIPFAWAYPADLPVAAKDNFFDLNSRGWYLAMLEGKFGEGTSLVDLRFSEDGICKMMTHDFEGHIKPVEISVNDLSVRFLSVDKKFKSRRRLSRLKTSYLW